MRNPTSLVFVAFCATLMLFIPTRANGSEDYREKGADSEIDGPEVESLKSLLVGSSAVHSVPGSNLYPSGGMKRFGIEYLLPPEEQITCGVVDAAAGYAYLATYDAPVSSIIKVALGSGGSPPNRIGALKLESPESYVSCGVIDPGAGYAYFGTSRSPAKVIKIALGEADALPTRVGALTLESGEQDLETAVIDPGRGYAYFVASSPTKIVKIALDSGDAPPRRVGAVAMPSGDIFCGAINTSDAYACFATYSPWMRVTKYRLGSGESLPSLVKDMYLDSCEGFAISACLVPQSDWAFSSTGTSPARS